MGTLGTKANPVPQFTQPVVCAVVTRVNVVMKSGAVNVNDSGLNIAKLPLNVYVTGTACASDPKLMKATNKDRTVVIVRSGYHRTRIMHWMHPNE
jgi:hypothetical protein